MMIKIQFNNEMIKIKNNLSILELLNLFGYKDAKIAVAVNQVFIPNKQYASVKIKSKDAIDIIFPMQGG